MGVKDSDPPDLRPAPGAVEKLDRLKGLLREMFQLDRGDLDFGIYRIMNLKAAEIAAFLDHDLLPQVKAKLNLTSVEEIAALEAQLDAARESVEIDLETYALPAMRLLQQRLAEMRKDATAESDVYNHLAGFFSRYYSEGDFVSQRRYASGGRSAYLIPYDGEEVKLYWANADQYYVKTTENYASYAFTVGTAAQPARRVCLEISAANAERDNVKEPAGRQRRFLLTAGAAAVAVEGVALVVRFEHRPLTDREKRLWPGNGATQQARINAATCERVLRAVDPDWQLLLAAPVPTEADTERTLLAKHVEHYTARNSFDYFIHKDLGGFLRRELDLFVNSEVLNPDDLEQGDAPRLDRALARVRAVRHVGGKIIDFLAQLENFQRQLWLKRKFVLETNWCVTLDRVPEKLLPEIAANEVQCEEWVRLFAVDEIEGSLINGGVTWSDPPSVDFLKASPHLVVDTRHFDRGFADRLLEALSDAAPLDQQLDGVLVHGDNFQALNLLQARYQGQVQCVYIDPPYNTGDSEILYKNGYLRSSWLALMAEPLSMVPPLLTHDPVVYVAIDDFEMVNLSALIDTKFPQFHRDMIIVNHHPQGGKATTMAHTHEYMLVCIPRSSNRTLVGRRMVEGAELRPFKRSGTAASNFRAGRPNSFYAILANPDSRHVVGLEPPPRGDSYPRKDTDDGLVRIYPIGVQGEERVWRRSYESCQELVHGGKLNCTTRNAIYQVIDPEERTAALFSNWTDSRYNAGTFGANFLRDILGDPNLFPYPKSLHTVSDAMYAAGLDTGGCVLDFFAGSGTTAHAVLSLNREDRGRRNYILVEMANHFDTVLLPRLKKVVYSADWKDGKPVSRDGVSQLVKYIRLESYEDTLDSLEMTPQSDSQHTLLADNPELAEDYRLRYVLGVETAGSACLLGRDFTDPFAYTITVVRDGARRAVPVDLTETFNYLIGLRVESRRRIDGVLAITGTDAERRRCLILWRNRGSTDHAALDAWFGRYRERFAGPLDIIYVNGDHTLNALQQTGDTWVAETIEPVFRGLMFGEE